MTVTIYGRVTSEDDPMHDPIFEQDKIMKRLDIDDLPATVARWLELGRRITGITR